MGYDKNIYNLANLKSGHAAFESFAPVLQGMNKHLLLSDITNTHAQMQQIPFNPATAKLELKDLLQYLVSNTFSRTKY